MFRGFIWIKCFIENKYNVNNSNQIAKEITNVVLK